MIGRTDPTSRVAVGSSLLALCVGLLSLTSLHAQSRGSDSAGSNQSQQTQTSATATEASDAAGKAKADTPESTVPLQSRVDLIPVRVVVRDMNGRPLANVRKQDFRVLEDGKPEDIAYFSVETAKALPQPLGLTDSTAGKAAVPSAEVAAAVGKGASNELDASFLPPAHFVAFLFDDVHIDTADLSRTRHAAIRFVDDSLEPTDRVAVYTISGQSELDFTANREKLNAALLGLRQRTMGDADTPGTRECPTIDYYQADRIVNAHDQDATNVAVYDALNCAYGDDPVALPQARILAMTTARRVNDAGEMQTGESFRRLEEVLQNLSSRPGQRSLVLLSPGFICPNNQYELADVIDRANRLNIFINTLDARGLYTPDLGDAGLAKVESQCGAACNGAGWLTTRDRVRAAGQSAQSQTLDALAEGTGGLSLHNNDLAGELRSLASLPEVSYLIAFTPRNLKYDGKFHKLKVSLATKEHVAIQARRGFYDPKRKVSAQESEKQELEQAVYSRETEEGVPVEFQTQYEKINPSDAKVTVLAHLDIGQIQFEKSGGRSDDDLIIVTALFDRNGKILRGIKKAVQLSLLDATLQKLRSTGMIVRTIFDVKPGNYLVRLVVLDANASQLWARSVVVQMPR